MTRPHSLLFLLVIVLFFVDDGLSFLLVIVLFFVDDGVSDEEKEKEGLQVVLQVTDDERKEK